MQSIFTKYKNFLEKYKLLPSFSDESVFFVLLSIGVIYIVSPDLRDVLLTHQDVFVRLKSILVAGIAVTLYTTLFSHFRKHSHKWRMLLLMVTINILVAIFTINGVLAGPGNFVSLIFPALNILIALSMILFWLRDLVDTEMIPTKAANYSNIVYGSIIVTIIIVLCQYLLNIPWQTVLSISVAYACLFNKKSLASLPAIFSGRSKKIETIEMLARKATDACRIELLSMKTDNLFFSAVTPETSKIIIIPDHEQHNFGDYLHRWLFEQDRTTPYIAVAFYSKLEFKHQFKKNPKVMVIRSEVYPQKGEAYFFAELFKDASEFHGYNGIFTYQDRIKNDRFDARKYAAGASDLMKKD
ncbi:MAG: hypothetical protein KBC17_02725 [Candidatus Pacebacteria bacterium]|nr:hypothetical protein [Candidatus Paceibacterota bacterium]